MVTSVTTAGHDRSVSFLDELAGPDADALRDAGVGRRYRRDQPLFREGERSGRVALVLRGRVKIVTVGLDGTESVLGVRGAGELLGELAALDGEPRSATATALEPVDARLLTTAEFESLLASRPAIAIALLRLLAARLRAADRWRSAFGSHDVEGRLAALLLQLLDEHGSPDPATGGTRVDAPLTQADLGGMIGASREAVARTLRAWREAGLVDTRRRALTVLDRAAVADVAAGKGSLHRLVTG
jgi:CRP-like cAMP-binding protein